MNRIILFFAALAIVMSRASAAEALDKAALVGKWQLVNNAMDKDGKPCPFVGQQISPFYVSDTFHRIPFVGKDGDA